jgi:hypothetical protein
MDVISSSTQTKAERLFHPLNQFIANVIHTSKLSKTLNRTTRYHKQSDLTAPEAAALSQNNNH